MKCWRASLGTVVALLVSGCVPGVDRAEEPPTRARLPSPPLPARMTTPVSAERAPPPLIGGTLALASAGRFAIAADPERDKIWIVELARSAVAAELALQMGDEPGRVVEDAAGRVHVALRRGGALLTIGREGEDWKILSRRPVCAAPRGVAHESGADRMHVACAGGELVTLPAAPEAPPTRTLRLDDDLRDVVVSRARLLVSRFRAAEVLVVDPETGAVESRWRPPSSQQSEGVGPAARRTSAAVAWKMVAGARDGQVYMLHQRGLDDEVAIAPGGYGGTPCADVVESVVSSVGTASPAGALMDVVLAVDLAVSPDGQRMAVVAGASSRRFGDSVAGEVHVSNAPGASLFGCSGGGVSTTQPEPRTRRDAGVDIRGAAGVDAGADAGDGLGEPIEFRQPSADPVAVALTPAGHVVVQTREPATIQVLTASRPRVVTLSYDARADTGYDLFHFNGGARLACASCHPEGGDDGRTWTFAKIGPRRTQSLRGGIASTAPFHWNGDMKDLGHLMAEVFQGRMNGPAVTDGHVGVLGRWLDRIPGVPSATPADADAVARGKALFESPRVGCASCHNGPALTNNLTVNVGTGRALQVPSLRGVRWRAPFMHAGCAPTLKDRFTNPKCGGGDRHGVTSKLTSTQIDDLVTYLETL